MGKIEFKDYPDTTTPINANNLNEIQKKDLITVKLLTSYVIKERDTYEEIPFTEETKIGDKLFLDNGQIVIGRNVNHVKISYTVKYDTIVTAGQKYATLYKNDTGTSLLENTYGNNRCIINATDYILEVQENDRLDVRCYGTVGDTLRSQSTFFTVEVID